MKNKKIIKFKLSTLLFCAGVAATIFSCKKEFLQPEPLSFFEPDLTFSTKSGLDAAVGITDRHLMSYWITDDIGQPMNTEYMFSDVAVPGKTDDAGIFSDISVRLTPTNRPEKLDYFWTETYRGIKYANTVLKYTDRVTGMDEATKNQYKGRALFHRAFRYMALCFQFKDVPLVTTITEVPKTNYRSTKREAILNKITADMEQAVQWVPEQKDMSLIGLINKGACRQLLIKCYMATGQFDKALKQADTLINNSGYSLMNSSFGTFYNPYPKTWPITRNVIWDLHRPENKAISANKETILVMINRGNTDMKMKMNSMRNWLPMLDNSATSAPDGKQAVMFYAPLNGNGTANTNYRDQYDYDNALGRGIAHIRPTYFAQKTMWVVNGTDDQGDLRHNSAVGNWARMDSLKYNNPASTAWFGKNLRLRNTSGALLCTDTVRNWFDWPHYKYYVEDPIETQNASNSKHAGGSGDWYCYRLAETYLLRAEAKFYLGDIAGATADVNRIRQRANCTQLFTSVTIGDIMDERARELNMEEWRFTELSRVSYSLALSGKPDEWGNTYTADNLWQNSYWYQRIQHYSDFYNKGKVTVKNRSYTIAPHNINWPIPQTAIDANGGAKLRQCPGYTGYDAGIPMWEKWEDAVADEANKE